MRNEKEIEAKKQEDIKFILSAVTSELHDIAYLQYFGTWENNGGMQWFFDECIQITEQLMMTEGSKYLEWLEHWKVTTDKTCEGFTEITGETCFDWYHMNEATKEFKSRYDKDEDIKEQYSESIGSMLCQFDSTEVDGVIADAIKYVEKRKTREKVAKFNAKVKEVIQELKNMEVDGETMEHIIDEVGMYNQMQSQLKEI